MAKKADTLNGHASNGHVRNPTVSAASSNELLADVPQLQTGFNWAEATLAVLIELNDRTDGWLRVIVRGDGKQVYAKWKFTRGVHKMRYVMYVDDGGNIARALIGLCEKLGKVDVGSERPALDTFYDPR